MTVIYLASTSSVKRRNFAELLEPHGYAVENLELRTQEVQAIDVRVVSRRKAEEAARLSDSRPVLVDDTGLELPDLMDAPGALLKPILNHGGVALLDRMTRSFQVDGQCRARYVCALTMADDDRVIEAAGSWDGLLDFSGKAGEVSADVRDCSSLFRTEPGRPTLTEQAAVQGSAAYLHRARAVQNLLRNLAQVV